MADNGWGNVATQKAAAVDDRAARGASGGSGAEVGSYCNSRASFKQVQIFGAHHWTFHLFELTLVQLGILCSHLHAGHEHVGVSCAFAAEHKQSISCGQGKMALPEVVTGEREASAELRWSVHTSHSNTHHTSPPSCAEVGV